jgi:hypothetical protein
MGHVSGRPASILKTMAAALCLVALSSAPALASEDNFNQGAYDSASQTGIGNANCNSALILVCDSASGAPAAVPGALGLGAVFGTMLAGGAVAMRRRRDI